jgi:hypothetical protein
MIYLFKETIFEKESRCREKCLFLKIKNRFFERIDHFLKKYIASPIFPNLLLSVEQINNNFFSNVIKQKYLI